MGDDRSGMQEEFRYVFVHPHLEIGGAERQTVLLANFLRAQGAPVDIILHRAKGSFLDLLHPAIPVHDLGLEDHLLMPVVAKRLLGALRDLPPALVIVKLWSSLLAAGLISGRAPAMKFVMHEDLDPSSHWRYIRAGRLKREIIKHVYRNADVVSAHSHSIARNMVRVYGLASTPWVVPPAVNQRDLQLEAASSPYPEKADTVRFVSVGSLIRRKGLDRVASLLPSLSGSWEWVIVGTGPESESLHAQIPSELRSRVLFLGELRNPYGVIRSADFLLHVPRSESFGVVIIEALALGIPVLATNVIGPQEIRSAMPEIQEYLQLVSSDSPDSLLRSLQVEVDRGPRRSKPVVPEALVRPFSIESQAEVLARIASAVTGNVGRSRPPL